jgi:hypothetical protein
VLEEYDAALEQAYYHDEVMSRRLSDDEEHSLFDDDDDDDDMDLSSTDDEAHYCFWGNDCSKCAEYDGPENARYCFSCFNCNKPMNNHEGYTDQVNGLCCNLCAVKLWDSLDDNYEPDDVKEESLKRPYEAIQEDIDDGYDTEEYDEQYKKKHKIQCYAESIPMEVEASDNSESTNDTLFRLEMDNQRLTTLLEEQTHRTWVEYPENHHLTISYENGKRYVMVCPSSCSQYGSGLTLDDLSPDFI